MDDEKVTEFIAITGANLERSRQYLQMSDNDIQDAIELFFNMGGVDLRGSAASSSRSGYPDAAAVQKDTIGTHETIDLDADDERELEAINSRQARFQAEQNVNNVEEDAAMARRLQEELYGSNENSSRSDGYRAPIAPTRETLVGPSSYDMADSEDMHAAVMEQLQQRSSRPQGRPGIFNQQATGSSSIWNESTNEADRQAELSRATGGASERSSKSTMLAEMFRPPFELLSHLSWDEARNQGREEQKWILINIQDPSIFDCQLLNRDLWKHEGIKETIKESFIFMQYSKDDPRGYQYMQYYFQDRDIDSAYPHIAIVDPRTGEQVKVWSGPPAPKPMDFLMQLHEFLDRYSLKVTAKNPVAKRKPEPRKETQVERMTEEEQLEMALQQSLSGTINDREVDPDDLTRSIVENKVEGIFNTETTNTENATGHSSSRSLSLFAAISSRNPHQEPLVDPKITTRIQLRHPSGRVVRRFALEDPVRRIYEWLKAEPLENMPAGTEFELVDMGKNLIGELDKTLEQAGLKNATINLEIIEN